MDSSPRAFAWPPTYGAEFEFTNDHLIQNGSSSGSEPHRLEKAELAKFEAKVRDICQIRNCTVGYAQGKYRGAYAFDVTLESGWSFHADVDPKCIEIQTKPLTIDELRQVAPEVNELIFETAKSIGLRPDYATGSGHFNMGVRSAFGDDPKAFLDYFVDYANHPEFAAGGMSYDMYNAPPISALSDQQRAALAAIVKETEEGKYSKLVEVANQITQRVYRESVYPHADPLHNQAFSIKKLFMLGVPQSKDQPLEIRAMPPQASMEDFILMAELTEKRLAFLKAEKAVGRKVHYINISSDLFSGEQVASRFSVYVVEAGGDWEHFKSLLRPVAREYQPDIFLTGKPDWKNPKYAQALEDHIRFIPTSRFLSERIRATLADPKAASGGGAKILEKIQAMATTSKDPEEQKAFREFLGEVQKHSKCSEAFAALGSAVF